MATWPHGHSGIHVVCAALADIVEYRPNISHVVYGVDQSLISLINDINTCLHTEKVKKINLKLKMWLPSFHTRCIVPIPTE